MSKGTTMDIRTAILKAADHIERNPSAFNYYAGDIPSSLEQKSCLLGWACYFAGFREGRVEQYSSPIGHGYMELTALARRTPGYLKSDMWDFQFNHIAAAGMLRLYADAHHPTTKPAIPREPVGSWASLAGIYTPGEVA